MSGAHRLLDEPNKPFDGSNNSLDVSKTIIGRIKIDHQTGQIKHRMCLNPIRRAKINNFKYQPSAAAAAFRCAEDSLSKAMSSKAKAERATVLLKARLAGRPASRKGSEGPDDAPNTSSASVVRGTYNRNISTSNPGNSCYSPGALEENGRRLEGRAGDTPRTEVGGEGEGEGEEKSEMDGELEAAKASLAEALTHVGDTVCTFAVTASRFVRLLRENGGHTLVYETEGTNANQ